MQIYLIFALVFALLVALFAIQNSGTVDIRFLTWSFPGVSLVLVIIGAAMGGAISIFLMGAPQQFGVKRRLREAQKQARELQDEIAKIQAQIRSGNKTDMESDTKEELLT